MTVPVDHSAVAVRRRRKRRVAPSRAPERRSRADEARERRLEARRRRWLANPLVATAARAYRLPLTAHVAALAIVLGLLAPHLNLLVHSWVTDEGIYAIQVQELQQGHWHYDYAGADFDAEGRWFLLPQATEHGDRVYPYVKHPVFPLALFATVTVFGDGLGFYVLPMVGLVLAAIAAWMLAARFEPRASRVAFWLVATSPLLVNAFVIWAHTLSAALAGFSVVLMLLVLRRRGLRFHALGLRAIGLGLLLALGILIRTEALLFAIALTIVIGLALLVQRRFLAAGIFVVTSAAATVLALAGEASLIAKITMSDASSPSVSTRGGVTPDGGDLGSLPSFFADRWDAFWRVMFDGSTTRGEAAGEGGALIASALMILAVSALGLLLKRSRGARSVGVGVAVAGVLVALSLYQFRFGLAPHDELSGHLAAWPIVVVGLTLLPWRTIGSLERWLVLLVTLYAGAVFATQYSEGGTIEWGGRFLSPTVVPVAVVVAVILVRRIPDRPWTHQWLVAGVLVLLVAVTALRGLVMLGGSRGENASLYGHLAEPGHEVVVVVDRAAWERPINAWSFHDQSDWYFAPSGQEVTRLLAHLARQGVGDVTLLGQEHVEHVNPAAVPIATAG